MFNSDKSFFDKHFEKVSKKDLIIALIIPALGLNAMLSSLKLYFSNTNFADDFEKKWGIPNEAHITGGVVEAFNDLGLFHPIVSIIIFIFTAALYAMLLIIYFEQHENKDSIAN